MAEAITLTVSAVGSFLVSASSPFTWLSSTFTYTNIALAYTVYTPFPRTHHSRHPLFSIDRNKARSYLIKMSSSKDDRRWLESVCLADTHRFRTHLEARIRDGWTSLELLME
jgi:hypothetical protein